MSLPNRRLGIFSISEKMIEIYPALFRKVMGKCIILNCDFLYAEQIFVYTALSDNFEEVSQGQLIPVYSINAYRTPYGIKIDFRKIEKTHMERGLLNYMEAVKCTTEIT